MRVSMKSLGAVALLSTSVAAQASASTAISYATALLGQLTPNCQQVVLSLVTPSSSLFQCLHVSSLAPLLTSNTSIVPVLDNYVSTICSSSPCSNATLYNVTQAITVGCATDLASYNISNVTVAQIVGTYPLAREVACLKTTNATIPATAPAYNTTNGTFCTTSLLSTLQSYLGTNITIPYITASVLGSNTTAYNLIKKIPAKMVCNDCIFAAIDLVEEEFPALASVKVAPNVTFNSFLNGTCNNTGFVVTTNGSLPSTIRESAVNSTYGFNITVGNTTITPANGTIPGPRTVNLTLRGEPAIKKRWFGKF